MMHMEFLNAVLKHNAMPCEAEDPAAQLLIEGGTSLLPNNPEWTLDTPLQDLADPKQLRHVLKNLNAIFLPAHSLAEDILENVTIGEMVTHLNRSRVHKTLDVLYKKERKGVIDHTHKSLEDLKQTIANTHE